MLETFQLPADFHSTGLTEDRLPPETTTNVYQIAPEALSNAFICAPATRIAVLLERRDHHVVLKIAGDGIRFASFKLRFLMKRMECGTDELA